MDNKNIYVKDAAGELIITERKGADVKHKMNVDYGGGIDACALYVQGRPTTKDNAIMKVNYEELTMRLIVNDFEAHGQARIKAQIKKNRVLDELMINKASVSPRELAKKIRMRPSVFADRSTANALVQNLYNMTSKYSAEMEDLDDRRGNTTMTLETKLQTSIPEHFDINLSLFRGAEKAILRVHTELEVRDKAIEIRLVCPDLDEKIAEQAKIIMDQEVAKIQDKVTVLYA